MLAKPLAGMDRGNRKPSRGRCRGGWWATGVQFGRRWRQTGHGQAYRHAVHFPMIRTLRHRGLKQLYERGDPSRVRADQAERIALALADLDEASKPSDLDLPGYRLHPLKGDLKGFWSISISANWRVIFRFEEGDAYDVNLVDYH